MKIALVVSTYNWTEALELCLMSIRRFSEKPAEIIIADDGSDYRTKQMIDRYRGSIPDLVHVWHEDNGFRLAEIRNKAISVSNSEYIVQIDGDVILHKDFIKDHRVFAKPGSFVKGRRTMIGKDKTDQLLRARSTTVTALSNGVNMREHGIRIPIFHQFFPAKEEGSAAGVMGSNMAFWRSDFVKVNGYNNVLQGWGAEDKELAQRLVNAGLKKRKIKFSAIQFHLYHQEKDRQNHQFQLSIIEELGNSGRTWCENGLLEAGKNFEIYG